MHTVLDNREWGNDFFRSLESLESLELESASFIARFSSPQSISRFRVQAGRCFRERSKGGQEGEKGTRFD